ncbi:hypothetical protein [Fibrisoma montanum]|nr:hypothetical protein [Fibrisoma montanum]
MKNHYLLRCLLWWLGLIGLSSQTHLQAQCPTGDVTLSTPAQVDAFPPGCFVVPGNLTISGADITDLSPLASLTSVGGFLSIDSNPLLTNVSGLSGLRQVGSSLVIASNTALPNLSGLESLASIGDDLIILNNPSLTSVSGLSALRQVGEDLEISLNGALISLSGVQSLTNVGRKLSIYDNPQLSLCATESICRLLATLPANRKDISNNAPGCATLAEVEANCAGPAITGFAASPNPVCAGSSVSFTATISNVVTPYSFTLTNGSSPLSGTVNTSAFSQSLTASDNGPQIFTLTVSSNGQTATATTSLTVISSPDYQPLVDLYNATNGPNWTNNTGWLSGCDPCTGNGGSPWSGVQCQNGRVTYIDLQGRNLTGSLPLSLSGLTSLNYLNLYNNVITGSIPVSLSALTALDYLSISFNQLTGSIPAGLSNLTRLTFLDFQQNQLSGCFPASLSALCSQSVSVNFSGNPGLPGGGNFATFCQGRPVASVSPTAQTVCVGSPVSLSASGGAYYSWSGPNNFTAAVANPGFVASSTAVGGVYSVTVSNGSCDSPVVSASITIQTSGGPSRLYVKANAAGANTGLNWDDAFPDLQSALNYSCQAGLTEIWVATGVYRPTTTTDRRISFLMKNGVAIYGGFLGTETELSQRPSITSTTPSSSTLTSNNSGNTYHIVYSLPGTNDTAILDGFMLTGGDTNNGIGEDGFGAAMFNDGSDAGNFCNPIIRNCAFVANNAVFGGAVYNDGARGSSSPTFINCLFANNRSYEGGAIYNQGIEGVVSPRFTNCAFINNTAFFGGQGGVMFNNDGDGLTTSTFTNCSFAGNRATETGGAVYELGGNRASFTTFVNCVLFNNGGGQTFAIRIAGGSLPRLSYSLIDATATNYTDNGNNLTTTVSPFVSATDLTLTPCSPAINAGLSSATGLNGITTDLASNPRFFSNAGAPAGIVDMGAYEYQANPTLITVSSPAVTTAIQGQPFSQSFTASGGVGPYSYSLASGSLPPSLSLSSAGVLSGTPTEAASYSVLVTASDANGCSGTGTTYELTVRPSSLFTVVQAPANQTACVGSRVTFSVRVAPDQGVTYAWFKNSADPRQPIQATTPDYTVEITDGGKAGRYIVRITGADGTTVEQRELVLTVNQRPVSPPPTSTRRQLCPDATPVNLGQYVSRTNNSYLVRYYQSTGQLLASSSVVLDQPGTYAFSATQVDPATGCESVPTSFTLTVNPATQLVSNPAGQTVCSGSTVTLTVQATGSNLRYEWFRGSVANQNKLFENASRQTGTTTASLTLVRVSQSEPYYVRVTGDCGVVVSGAIAVTVQACGARQGVSEAVEPGLQVRVLGNPTAGEWMEVALSGVGSESVRLVVSDERGHVLSEQGLAAGQGDGRHRVALGPNGGVYLLRVSTPSRQQVVKLLKH